MYCFFCFFKWALSTRADDCRLRQVYSILSLVVFLSFMRFLLNVERVRFVFRMRNASPLSQVKSVHGPARLLSGVELIWANFSAVAPMLTKIEAWLTRNPLKCCIKIIPQILKVLLTKPYKRLWKKSNQILVACFIPKLLFLTLSVSLYLNVLRTSTLFRAYYIRKTIFRKRQKKSSWVRN